MYEEFFGFTVKPFSLSPDPSFLYLSEKHKKALTMLRYGIISQVGFTVITGEIGCGKTTLIRKLIENDQENINIGLLNNTQCKDNHELMCWIAYAFGIDFQGMDRVELYSHFVDYLVSEYGKGKRAVLIIDEAQELGAPLLEQVRMLSNINVDKHLPIQFILSGQPELHDLIRLPEMEQFAQRVVVDYHLNPLDKKETRDYIKFRLSVAGSGDDIFTDEASEIIWSYSRGVPRLINVICDTALVYAFSAQSKLIDIALVKEVINDRSDIGRSSNMPLANNSKAF